MSREIIGGFPESNSGLMLVSSVQFQPIIQLNPPLNDERRLLHDKNAESD